MSSEIAKYLRYLINGDKAGKITALTVKTTPTEFTTFLDTDNYFRKHCSVYNNSPSTSGECYYGFSGEVTSATGKPIPKGAEIELMVAQNVSIYFCAVSGEVGDLRIEEIA